MKHLKNWVLWSRIAMVLAMLGFALNSFAQCLSPGTPVNFFTTGYNTATEYTTTHVLTTHAGVIIQTVATGFAAPGADGTYNIYTVNYENNAAPALTAGTNISTVTGPCVATSTPLSFCVTGGCVSGGTAISFTATGQNTSVGYETRYVLTTDADMIISNNTSSPITAPGTTGSYKIYVVNYNTANGATAPSLTAGTTMTATGGTCSEVSVPILFCVSSPLPVKLLAFTVKGEGSVTQLKWTTTEEINAARFDIQRSDDAKDWLTIGEKEAAGESKALLDYNFTDTQPLPLNYYRLKMIDKDSKFAYSSIKSVKINPVASHLRIYPNPVSDVLFLKDDAGAYLDLRNIKEVAIFNATGNVVYKSDAASIAMLASEGIPVGKLLNGIYAVNVTKADGTATAHRIVVLR
jgi:hypothetical protein